MNNQKASSLNMKIESYDLTNYFEIYLEAMRSIFISSHKTEKEFEDFVGSHGEKYFQRLKIWTDNPKNFLKHIKMDGQIIGIVEATIIKENQSAQLSSLYVREDKRGQGIAQSAEIALVDFFKNQNVKQIFLNVTKTNYRAINFYKKQGWIESDEKQYPDAIRLFKKINF